MRSASGLLLPTSVLLLYTVFVLTGTKPS